jgi:O-antigen/teichoic acid export membrane protein
VKGDVWFEADGEDAGGVAPPPGSHAEPALSLGGRIRHLAQRLSWGIADQALSSLTNFAVGIYVARSLGARGLGAFSLAFVTYQVALNASRGLATDPLLVRYSGAEAPRWRGAVVRATGVAIAVGVVVGALCLVGGMQLAGSTGAAFLALGVTLPGLLLQDSWRFSFFSAGRGGQAFANDLVWALTLCLALAAIAATGPASVFWFVLAWGGSAMVAAVVGGVQARLIPRLSQAADWLREHRDLAPRYLGENLSISGAYQLRSYGLGAVAGLAAVGSLRGAELLVGPFNVVIMGVGMMAVPEAVQVLHRSARQLRPFCLLLGGLQAGAAAAWGLVLLLLLPGGLGARLLGPSWQPASELLVPVILTVVNAGFSAGASAGLRALGAASRSLRAQVVGSAAYVACSLGGATVGGAAGAAWGSAIATLIGAAVWWWQLRTGLHVRFAESAVRGEAASLHRQRVTERSTRLLPVDLQSPMPSEEAEGRADTRVHGGTRRSWRDLW